MIHPTYGGNIGGGGGVNGGGGIGSGANAATGSLQTIKQQLISLFMFKSSTAKGNDLSSVWAMIWSIMAITLVERVFGGIPVLLTMLSRYVERGVKDTRLLKTISAATEIKQKKASITIEIFIHKSDALLGQAILDYMTNLPNIKSIFYKKSFVLNHKEEVLVDANDQIYMRMKSEFTMEQQNADSNDASATQIVEVYSYLLTVDELRAFLDRIVADYTIKIQNKLGDRIYYFNELACQCFYNADGSIDYSKMPNHLMFTMKPFVTNRRFKNVIGPESKMIQKRIEFFKANKRWYDDKGIPYTFGLLLSGPPGGGKTSTIKCVANEMKRHIINVSLHQGLTKTQMENLFFNDMIHVVHGGKTEQFIIPIHKRIYVFEDVDCQNNAIVMDREMVMDPPLPPPKDETVLGKALPPEPSVLSYTSYSPQEPPFASFAPPPAATTTNVKTQPNKKADNPTLENLGDSEKLSLSHLLNILDGILESPGRIVIFTSNYPKKLDKALIRPGRIDLICEFTKCTHAMIVEFFENFYDMTLTDAEKRQIASVPEYQWTPAEMTKIMFEHFNDYREALSVCVGGGALKS